VFFLMPPLPKSPDRRQRRNKRPGIALVPSGAAFNESPAPPEGLLQITVSRWVVFWATEEGKATRQAELPQVERLFELMDERERVRRAIRKRGRMVKGSQGQPVANPLLRYAGDCEREIRALEDRLGLSRRAMVALGSGFASAQRGLDELNRSMNEDDDDQDDPRLRAVQ
jgi:P27 family predicted phage terminase small subunit